MLQMYRYEYISGRTISFPEKSKLLNTKMGILTNRIFKMSTTRRKHTNVYSFSLVYPIYIEHYIH